MPEKDNIGGNFEPIHAAHAIEQVIFIVRFENPIEQALLDAVLASADKFTTELPIKTPFDGITITINQGQQPQPMPSKGCVLSRTGPDGEIESELRLDNSSITFRTTRYTRWADIWHQARSYMESLVPKYIQQTVIVGIGLNYFDKFKWSGDFENCQPSMLLNKQSKYISPNVFEESDFWHSHTGAFRRANDQTKRLLNLNIDYLDEIRVLQTQTTETRRIIAITTVLTDLFNQDGYEQTGVVENAVQFIDEHMQELHNLNKALLSDVISDEMKKRIALTTN